LSCGQQGLREGRFLLLRFTLMRQFVAGALDGINHNLSRGRHGARQQREDVSDSAAGTRGQPLGIGRDRFVLRSHRGGFEGAGCTFMSCDRTVLAGAIADGRRAEGRHDLVHIGLRPNHCSDPRI
jgi:hypothetical protein